MQCPSELSCQHDVPGSAAVNCDSVSRQTNIVKGCHEPRARLVAKLPAHTWNKP